MVLLAVLAVIRRFWQPYLGAWVILPVEARWRRAFEVRAAPRAS